MNKQVKRTQVAIWSKLEAGKPAYALVGNVDLVVVRWADAVAEPVPLR